MTSFISNEGLKKDENVMTKGIYLESPNKKFVEKYIFFHPKTQFFTGDSFLERINRAVDV